MCGVTVYMCGGSGNLYAGSGNTCGGSEGMYGESGGIHGGSGGIHGGSGGANAAGGASSDTSALISKMQQQRLDSLALQSQTSDNQQTALNVTTEAENFKTLYGAFKKGLGAPSQANG